MQTYLWNPWSTFDQLERMMFAALRSPEWPVFGIEDSDDETVLTADFSGMTEDDIELTLAEPMLIVRGERKAKDGRYLARQRFSGAFEKHFRLGDGYDLDQVKTHITNGVLTITLMKAAKTKPRRIKLTTGVVDKVRHLLAGDKDSQRAA